MSDTLKAIADLGLSAGLLVVALWYIATKTVQKSVYDETVSDKRELAKSVGRMADSLAALLERERGRA